MSNTFLFSVFSQEKTLLVVISDFQFPRGFLDPAKQDPTTDLKADPERRIENMNSHFLVNP